MAQAESFSLWPAMALVDRVHEDRRSGDWPPLFRNGRVFAYEVTAHALFGAVLGGLLSSTSASAPLLFTRFRQRSVELSLDVFVDRSRAPGFRLFVRI